MTEMETGGRKGGRGLDARGQACQSDGKLNDVVPENLATMKVSGRRAR